MRKIILNALPVVFAMALTACDSDPVKLKSPVLDVLVEDELVTVSWEAVDNAASYSWKLNDGDESMTDQCEVRFELDAPEQKFTVYVKALPGGAGFEESEWASSEFEMPLVYVPLDAQGSANCYVVAEAGKYSFDATVRGNEKDASLSPASVEVIWSDRNISELLSGEPVLKDGKIRFEAKGQPGNVLVGVKSDKSSEEFLWSWHIWLAGGEVSDEIVKNADGTSFTVMNRALGSYSAKDDLNATLYQWGRKDPFSNTSSVFVGGTEEVSSDTWYNVVEAMDDGVEYAIAHPDTFIKGFNENGTDWSNRDKSEGSKDWTLWYKIKSVYDPCPYGYRVPSPEIWTAMTSENGTWKSNGYIFPLDNGQVSWYPAVGLRNSTDGSLRHHGEDAGYWSCERYGTTNTACDYYLYDSSIWEDDNSVRAFAYAMRCVRE